MGGDWGGVKLEHWASSSSLLQEFRVGVGRQRINTRSVDRSYYLSGQDAVVSCRSQDSRLLGNKKGIKTLFDDLPTASTS